MQGRRSCAVCRKQADYHGQFRDCDEQGGERRPSSLWGCQRHEGMKLFDQTGRCVQYIPVKDPQFTGRDITGDPVESVSTEFDVTDVESLQFRVLLNTDGLNDANGNPLVLAVKQK